MTFFNNTTMRLEPGTMVQFDEVEAQYLDIVLLAGKVNLVQAANSNTSVENETPSEKQSLMLKSPGSSG